MLSVNEYINNKYADKSDITKKMYIRQITNGVKFFADNGIAEPSEADYEKLREHVNGKSDSEIRGTVNNTRAYLQEAKNFEVTSEAVKAEADEIIEPVQVPVQNETGKKSFLVTVDTETYEKFQILAKMAKKNVNILVREYITKSVNKNIEAINKYMALINNIDIDI